MEKGKESKKGIFVKTIICAIVSIILLTAFFAGNAYAATIDKRHEKTHAMTIDDKPLLVAISVKASDTYTGTYTTSGTTRKFTKHSESVGLSSLNDRVYTSRIKGMLTQLKFYTPSNSISCPQVTCHCAFYIGHPLFRVLHQCSTTKTTCQIGSSAYVKGGYTLVGCTIPIIETVKFTGIAN